MKRVYMQAWDNLKQNVYVIVVPNGEEHRQEKYIYL